MNAAPRPSAVNKSLFIIASHGGGWEAMFEYFRKNCPHFAILYLSHHYAEKGDRSTLHVYQEGRQVGERRFVAMHPPHDYRLALMPLVYFLHAVAVVRSAFEIRRRKAFDAVIGYTAFGGFCAWLAKKVAGLRRAVYFSADFFPLKGRKGLGFYWVYMWLTRKLDEWALLHCDAVWYNNPRQIEGRAREGVRKRPGIRERSLPLCITPEELVAEDAISCGAQIRICYLGQLTAWQCVEVLIEALPDLLRWNKNLHMTFIGSAGHGVDALRERAAELGAADHVTFHGFISDQRRIDEILRQCDIGVAIYLDDPNAPMIYGDPAKVKRYLAAGLAVITSAVAVIAPEIEQFQAGRVVTNNKDEFCRAVRELAENPQKLAQFRKNALPLARKYLDAEILKDVWDDL